MRFAAAFAALTLLMACGRGGDEASLRFDRIAGQSELQHGERLARVLGCAGCHGADLTGQPWEEDANLAISFSSNLTRALPAYSDGEIDRAVRAGVRPDGTALWGMPSEIFLHLDQADMASLISYLRTLRPAGVVHPRIVFGPRGRREVATGAYKAAPVLVSEGRSRWPAALDGRHGLARYIARATCAECHGLDLSGQGTPPERTPDLIVAGAYSRAQFHHLLRTGVPVGGRQLVLMDVVARSRFAHLTDHEVDALYDYLAARAQRAP